MTKLSSRLCMLVWSLLNMLHCSALVSKLQRSWRLACWPHRQIIRRLRMCLKGTHEPHTMPTAFRFLFNVRQISVELRQVKKNHFLLVDHQTRFARKMITTTCGKLAWKLNKPWPVRASMTAVVFVSFALRLLVIISIRNKTTK